YLEQDKYIDFEEILDNDVMERISCLNEINRENKSSKILDNDLEMIQNDDDNSTINDDDDPLNNDTFQDIIEAFTKILSFLNKPPNNINITQLEIESVKVLYEKIRTQHLE
ncbi:1345_t:CDS:1, partial [Gigaspora margarita]